MTRPPGFVLLEVDEGGGGFPRRAVLLSPLDVASVAEEPTGMVLGGIKVARVVVHSLSLGRLPLALNEWIGGREIVLASVLDAVAVAMGELREIVPEKKEG